MVKGILSGTCFSWGFFQLCTSMRTDIILRIHSNYKPPISHPLHRNNPSRMNLGWEFSRQSHCNTILCIPLYPAFHHHSPHIHPPIIPPWNRFPSLTSFSKPCETYDTPTVVMAVCKCVERSSWQGTPDGQAPLKVRVLPISASKAKSNCQL